MHGLLYWIGKKQAPLNDEKPTLRDELETPAGTTMLTDTRNDGGVVRMVLKRIASGEMPFEFDNGESRSFSMNRTDILIKVLYRILTFSVALFEKELGCGKGPRREE